MSFESPFSVERLSRIEFGSGKRHKLVRWLAEYGRCVLVVTGARSFVESPHWAELRTAMAEERVQYSVLQVSGEPSPDWVDEQVAHLAGQHFDVVLGIGGGSVLDAAKALAGLLLLKDSVMEYLEGVGKGKRFSGPTLPLVAVPTTAGTGSEATKNAVVGRIGPTGFKKSFRDQRLMPALAVVDPDFLAGCPRQLLAAAGMDALTQLLESYFSTRANELTDALAVSGLTAVSRSLRPLFDSNGEDAQGRAGMAYAALISGINLTQTGLGSVHGLAAALGAFFPIPHGVICGTLVAGATRTNIDALVRRDPESPALTKLAVAGRILCGCPELTEERARTELVRRLVAWSEHLGMPRLRVFGVATCDIDRIVAAARGSSMRTNPLALSDREIGEIVADRI